MHAPELPVRVYRFLKCRYNDGLIAQLRAREASESRVALARGFIRGSGIEIGALHSPLPVPEGVTVRYVDRIGTAEARRHYGELAHQGLVDVDVVDDGETLKTFATASQDFIIANHLLEHTQDPIGTIKRYLDVLRPQGVLFLAVPDKRWSFDCDRRLTPFAHLLRDHKEGPGWSYDAHVREYASLVDKRRGAELEEKIAEIKKAAYSIHFHVWDEPAFAAFLGALRSRLLLPFDIERLVLLPGKAEVVAILRKHG